MRKSKNPNHPLVILRNDHGLTQESLAEILDYSTEYISQLENRKTVPRKCAEKIKETFKEYGYNIDWLLGKSPYKTDEEKHFHDLKSYNNPLEFEKDWIRKGGGAHPLNSLLAVEARIAVALENMNESGWRVAVDMIESLSTVQAFQNFDKQGGK